MDKDNPNSRSNPSYQNDPNNVTRDPNLLNHPQLHLLFQLQNRNQAIPTFNSSPQFPINSSHSLSNQYAYNSSQNNLIFPLSQHFSQPIKHSPGGDGSSNQTPNEDIRQAQHLEDIDEVVVELFPSTTNNQRIDNVGEKSSKKKWSIQEDEALGSAYLNSEGDTKKGTNQSQSQLWNNIVKLYAEAQESNHVAINPRTMKSLQTHWDTINTQISRWVGVYSAALRDKRSGESEEDVETKAHISFREMYNDAKFNLIYVWKTLRHDQWGVPTSQFESESGGSSKRSESDSSQAVEDINVRPEGIKKAKRKAKESSTSSINMNNFTISLDDSNDLGERMLNFMKERHEQRQKEREEEKLAKQEEKKLTYLISLASKPALSANEKEIYDKLTEELKHKWC